MQVKYLGPSGEVNVVPYGPHRKGDVEEYPDDFAEELLATSKKQKFKAVGGRSEPEPESESETEEKEGEAESEPEAAIEPELTIDDMTVAEIKAELDVRGVEYDDKARKAELFELYKSSIVN